MARIVRSFFERENETIKTGVTIAEAKAHCSNPESSWKTATLADARKRTEEFGPWFDLWYADGDETDGVDGESTEDEGVSHV